MTPQDIAEEYRSYLAINIHTAPANSKLVVHSTLEYFLGSMDQENSLRTVSTMDKNCDVVIRSEW